MSNTAHCSERTFSIHVLQHVLVSQDNITCGRTRAVSEFVGTAHNHCPKNLPNVFVRLFKIFYRVFLACWAILILPSIFSSTHCWQAILANRLVTLLAFLRLVKQIQAHTTSQHLLYRIANDIFAFLWIFIFLTFVNADPSMGTFVLPGPNEHTVSFNRELWMFVSFEVDCFD